MSVLGHLKIKIASRQQTLDFIKRAEEEDFAAWKRENDMFEEGDLVYVGSLEQDPSNPRWIYQLARIFKQKGFGPKGWEDREWTRLKPVGGAFYEKVVLAGYPPEKYADIQTSVSIENTGLKHISQALEDKLNSAEYRNYLNMNKYYGEQDRKRDIETGKQDRGHLPEIEELLEPEES